MKHALESHYEYGTRCNMSRVVISVVLNFNSAEDVERSVPQLLEQQGLPHTVVLVDNASSPECVARLRTWISRFPSAVTGTAAEVAAEIHRSKSLAEPLRPLYFVLNPENRGYSAGNNVGIRLALAAGAEAVLIANPDMRFDDTHYVNELSRDLFSSPSNVVAASSVVGTEGEHQNPMREPGFWEEFFWPRRSLARLLKLKPPSHVLPTESANSREVPKVSGCCLMMRASFLEEIGLLDEAVFLYCEEPILSAAVRRHGSSILYVPRLRATHAHVASTKGDPRKRMKLFISSRMYYLRKYSGYAAWQLALLRGSYALLSLALWGKRQ